MPKKNNKGYFLAETVVVLTIVAGVITTLYVNSMKTYAKRKNEIIKYNTVDGLYSAKIIKEYLSSYEDNLKKYVNNDGYTSVNDYLFSIYLYSELFNDLNVDKVYLSSSNMNKILNENILPDDIKESLNMISNKNECKYRYIILFNDSSYSSVGIECERGEVYEK